MEYHVHVPRHGDVFDLDVEQRVAIRSAIEAALEPLAIEPIVIWRPNPARSPDEINLPMRRKARK